MDEVHRRILAALTFLKACGERGATDTLCGYIYEYLGVHMEVDSLERLARRHKKRLDHLLTSWLTFIDSRGLLSPLAYKSKENARE